MSILRTKSKTMWKLIVIAMIGTAAGGKMGRIIERDDCGRNYVQSQGSLTSPNYNSGSYPPDIQCTWTIQVPDGKVVQMDFETIDIEEETDCAYDRVIIYDIKPTDYEIDLTNVNTNSKLSTGRKYCGSEKVSYHLSTTNQVEIKFYSDKRTQGKGFKLNWSAVDVSDENQFNCTFEQGLCRGWRNSESPNDDFDWELKRGRTATRATGPRLDHTLKSGNGQYMYIETLSPQKPNDTAILISPPIGFKQDEDRMCISFWFLMYGKEMGSLALAQVIGGSKTVLWMEVGQQDSWNRGLVELASVKGNFSMMFVGIKGKGFPGGIAIDDIMQTTGPCSDVTTLVTESPVTHSTLAPSTSTKFSLRSNTICNSHDFKCTSENMCIPLFSKCDGRNDCPDGDDEFDCPNRNAKSVYAKDMRISATTPQSTSTTSTSVKGEPSNIASQTINKPKKQNPSYNVNFTPRPAPDGFTKENDATSTLVTTTSAGNVCRIQVSTLLLHLAVALIPTIILANCR